MSNGQEDISSQPLVIVRRRRGGGDEEHHGGVWKIAYADFMTAMMAFFLVMWLVNAADKQTIVKVAAYFNPIRLTDRSATVNGIEDIDEALSTIPNQKGKKKKPAEPAKSDGTEVHAEQPAATSPVGDETFGDAGTPEAEAALFANPVSELDKLAKSASARSTQFAIGASDASPPHDPFDPAATIEADKELVPAAPSVTAEIKTKTEPEKPETVAAPVGELKKPQADWTMVEDDIKARLHDLVSALPDVEAKVTPEGLLISVLDNKDFTMFAVGSARPHPELVLVMERIANVLKTVPGRIIMRGHTDGRPYRNGLYDNWRLSSARAQMAQYMLTRGGIDDKRIVAVEGRADRDLKDAGNILSEKNRRIEILVKGDRQ
ncbi:MAG: OmpA family protein [Hyphomicrobium sp.]|nr:OmpA family protein [Hyphomicrobium sp.]